MRGHSGFRYYVQTAAARNRILNILRIHRGQIYGELNGDQWIPSASSWVDNRGLLVDWTKEPGWYEIQEDALDVTKRSHTATVPTPTMATPDPCPNCGSQLLECRYTPLTVDDVAAFISGLPVSFEHPAMTRDLVPIPPAAYRCSRCRTRVPPGEDG